MNWTVGIGMIGVMALGGISPALIDRAVENSLKQNFGPFKKLEVRSKTDFMSLLNGKVDGLSVKAGDFQVDGLPVQRMDIQTGAMRFDTWGALRGQARWLNEIEATASGALDEPALNSLIARPFVQNQLKNIKVNLPMAETAAIENLAIAVIENRIELKGNIDIGNGFPLPFRLSGAPLVLDHRLFIRDVDLQVMGMTLAPALYQEALRKPLEMPVISNLRYRLDSLEPRQGRLEFRGSLWLSAVK
ncbi:MAG TPA: hypothetical protein DD435_14245 [Cyanobacteria bacterium UBA8530]|nr:hypothetical protein [Cyanobacteria bacterium UBA8530]